VNLNSRQGLQHLLEQYTSSFPEEEIFIADFRKLLNDDRCYFRDHLPGHITGSAWIINPFRTHVILLHHTKLNRWLQPGGHADGDEDIAAVALREAQEETGLHHFTILNPGIFDLDIHPIPARSGFPEHLHYDVRILLEARDQEPLILSHESREVAWIAVDDVLERSRHNTSIHRMLMKSLTGK
jgi:8-oxo-dGTP pyrophosphatase MutT (NUDIX family)